MRANTVAQVLRLYYRQIMASWVSRLSAFAFFFWLVVLHFGEFEHPDFWSWFITAWVMLGLWEVLWQFVQMNRVRLVPGFAIPHLVVFGALLATSVAAIAWRQENFNAAMVWTSAYCAFSGGMLIFGRKLGLLLAIPLVVYVLPNSLRAHWNNGIAAINESTLALTLIFFGSIAICQYVIRVMFWVEDESAPDPEFNRPRLWRKSLSTDRQSSYETADDDDEVQYASVTSARCAFKVSGLWQNGIRWLCWIPYLQAMVLSAVIGVLLAVGVPSGFFDSRMPLNHVWVLAAIVSSTIFAAGLIAERWIWHWPLGAMELLRPNSRRQFLRQLALGLALQLGSCWAFFATSASVLAWWRGWLALADVSVCIMVSFSLAVFTFSWLLYVLRIRRPAVVAAVVLAVMGAIGTALVVFVAGTEQFYRDRAVMASVATIIIAFGILYLAGRRWERVEFG